MPSWLPYLTYAMYAVLLGLLAGMALSQKLRLWAPRLFGAIGLAMMVSGAYLALVVAPADREMGDVSRIMYAHVPEVWMALLALTVNFVTSMAYLFRKSMALDAVSEACAEVGVFFGAIGVLLGAIWGRPTWGVWWDWDPRLTTAAIMLVVYSGYLALRKFVDDPEKRATWSSVVGIIAFVDLPILWFSVRWWRSLHQRQSGAGRMESSMRTILMWNVAAFLAITLLFIIHRYRIAAAARSREVALPSALPPDEGVQPTEAA